MSPRAEVAGTVDELAACTRPTLIGVRHHSPVLAAAMPALLDRLDPDALLVELPGELEAWVSWLGDPGTVTPVALAVGGADGALLGFYPFADFSPELAAIRWAVAAGVQVTAIDLPAAVAQRLPASLDGHGDPDGQGDAGGQGDHGGRGGAPAGSARGGEAEGAGPGAGLLGALFRRFQVPDGEELWDRLVEAPSYGEAPERVRRAALALGWAMRVAAADGGGVPRRDLLREAWMRRRVAAAMAAGAARPVAVVGAFHAPALLPHPDPALWVDHDADLPPSAGPGDGAEPVTALIPYTFELLDSRSGYPAGIRDPVWQQAVWTACGQHSTVDPGTVERAAAELIVRVCAELRRDRHVAGVPDAKEALRLAADLARLRGLAAPGRRELIESVQTALGHGEPLGRGRALARAAQAVLIGDRRGGLPHGAPRAGLAVGVEALLAELKLPGPGNPPDPAELRLDPHRSELDRRRHVALCRLRAVGVPYGAEQTVAGTGGADALGRRWTVAWSPTVAATLELAAASGLTLDQAAEGALRRRRGRLLAADEYLPGAVLALLAEAAECGLTAFVSERVAALRTEFLPAAGLPDLIAAHALLRRIAAGHVPGLPAERSRASDPEPYRLPGDLTLAELVAAAVASVEGLAGSDDLDDAAALLELVQLVLRERGEPEASGEGRLTWTLGRLVSDGSPLLQGAAAAALVLLGAGGDGDLGVRLASWVDAADAADAGGPALARRLQGALTMAAPLLESYRDLLDPLADRIERLRDEAFLRRLPALRDGFEVLSPAARQRFLEVIAARLDLGDGRELERRLIVDVGADQGADLPTSAAWATADAAGRAALAEHDPGLLATPVEPGALPAGMEGAAPGRAGAVAPPADGVTDVIDITIGPVDRWRLVLGRERERLPAAQRRVATALDQLYGHGRGEGSRTLGPDGGRGGGAEAPFPMARDWAEELEALFGTRIRDEVLARAAARGRADALLAVDPDAVVPSVDLLRQVLELKGALPEARLGQLRRLVDRIVTELVRELARRMRPALAGLTVPRPTRRPGGPIDLSRTVRANLHTARRAPGGGATLVPERPVFRTRARRSADWHVTIVVDVSGSMEASTIYSAIVAAVLNGLPALSVRFITFSTEVVDLSGRVDDPLGLLLEVAVGGGTDIGKGLAYARETLTVPRRSIVALVSDFEEGVSVGRLLAEVRALAESGAHLLGLAALDDRGQPAFNRGIAEQVVAAGMAVAALTPLELARWIGERVRG